VSPPGGSAIHNTYGGILTRASKTNFAWQNKTDLGPRDRLRLGGFKQELANFGSERQEVYAI
jgi:hypothetical protein